MSSHATRTSEQFSESESKQRERPRALQDINEGFKVLEEKKSYKKLKICIGKSALLLTVCVFI